MAAKRVVQRGRPGRPQARCKTSLTDALIHLCVTRPHGTPSLAHKLSSGAMMAGPQLLVLVALATAPALTRAHGPFDHPKRQWLAEPTVVALDEACRCWMRHAGARMRRWHVHAPCLKPLLLLIHRSQHQRRQPCVHPRRPACYRSMEVPTAAGHGHGEAPGACARPRPRPNPAFGHNRAGGTVRGPQQLGALAGASAGAAALCRMCAWHAQRSTPACTPHAYTHTRTRALTSPPAVRQLLRPVGQPLGHGRGREQVRTALRLL